MAWCPLGGGEDVTESDHKETLTGVAGVHKAHRREPAHVFNSEPLITFNTQGSFL